MWAYFCLLRTSAFWTHCTSSPARILRRTVEQNKVHRVVDSSPYPINMTEKLGSKKLELE
ncbi:unnamed protein product [Dovyalis caffra]|uniref:Uncharacterized protein n=1 Tax=Dovyalis caffra TaxID=77055 RepID=A0AAV1S057_9ROSI|nr:unnamed protein product [Dovyalis caffra]